MEIQRAAAASARQVEVARELRGIDALLGLRKKSSFPLLVDARIASPCDVPWDNMVGDQRVRHCSACEKNVYNLSVMTADEAEALLAERRGQSTCLRFYRRVDGSIMTEDCPVGAKKVRRRKRVDRTVGWTSAAAAAAAAALLAYRMVGPQIGEASTNAASGNMAVEE